jgi:hypothetical protein
VDLRGREIQDLEHVARAQRRDRLLLHRVAIRIERDAQA